MTPPPSAALELFMASIWDARARAEKALVVLRGLEAPAHLVEAIENSHTELAATADRLSERLAAGREAA